MTHDKMYELFMQAKGVRAQRVMAVAEKKRKHRQLKDELILLEQAQVFLQRVAKETQEQLKMQIEDIVNLALETCFPGEYFFTVNFRIARNKTEAELLFLSQKTGREIDPINASGGGVVDLAAFALRIACYALKHDTNNVIILDEPFRFISRDLQARAGDILRTLSKKMGLQIIMVSHIAEIIDAADRVFEVRKINNVSKIYVSDKNN